MSDASLLTASAPRPVFAALDPRLKLGWLLFISTLSVLVDSVPALIVVCVLGMAPLAAVRFSWKAAVAVVALLAITAWTTALSQALFYNAPGRTPLVTIIPSLRIGGVEWGVTLYREGFAYGLTQSLRLIGAAATGLAVCLTTSPERLLAAMAAWRLPPVLSFLTATTIRFLPLMFDEYLDVRRARTLRGYQFRIWGRAGRRLEGWRAEIGILSPLIANALRRARSLATSIVARGFEPAERPTIYPPLRARTWEKLAGWSMIGVVAIIAVLKIVELFAAESSTAPAALKSLAALSRSWL